MAGAGTLIGTGIVSSLFPLFIKSIDNARMAGDLIALAISLGLIFPNQTFSLAGYSLGSEAVKSCIKTLYECGAHHVLHEVAFLGGIAEFE